MIYHSRTFGGPFEIANRYINPLFRDRVGARIQLWGLFTLPDRNALFQLVFGWWRGILFSQPWVLFAAVTLPFLPMSRDSRRALIYGEAGLVLLLLMNASFGGWHGGAASGPRYLSAALPVFAIPVALSWNSLSRLLKTALWSGLAFSLLVFAIAKVRSPTSGLWPEWMDQFREKTFETSWKFALELLIAAAFVWPIKGRTEKSPARLDPKSVP